MPINAVQDDSSNSVVPMQPITAGEVRPLQRTNPLPKENIKEPGVFDALAPIPKFTEVKGYNPYDIKGELVGYEAFGSKFADSRSPQETEAIKHQIDAQKSVFGVESAGEFKTLMSASTVGFIVLVLLIFLLYRKITR